MIPPRLGVRIAHQARQPQAGLVDGRLRALKRNAIVGDEQKQRVVPMAGVLEDLHQPADALIEPGDRLVVLGQFGPARRRVGQKGRHDHVRGIETHRLHARVLALVAEQIGAVRFRPDLSAAVRIGRAEIQKKRPLVLGTDKLAAVLGHLHAVARIAGQGLVERIDRLGHDVELADPGGAISGPRQPRTERNSLIERAEMVLGVLQAVLAIGVVVHAAQDHRAAGAATGGGAKRVGEQRAVGGQRVEMRRLGHAVAIAAQLQSQIIGHDQHDVFLSGGRRC